ncbi:hypothetical protein [Maribacter sp. 2307ULW6-5]
MAREEVIGTKDGIKGCVYTGCFAVLLFVLSAAGYAIYIFYFDDSLG